MADARVELRSVARVIEHFERVDDARRARGPLANVFTTGYGIYGAADLRVLARLFEKIDLASATHFVDLGSGDGRVAILASLWCAATGIEGDPALAKEGTAAAAALVKLVPAVARCTLVQGDYTELPMRPYDVLFAYADHTWPAAFQERLQRECTGTLIVLQNIFPPIQIKKGPTLWVDQTPFVTFALRGGG